MRRRDLLMAAASAAPRQRPNIVVILADDLGAGDVGVFGSPHIRTPNLDRLAREGARLTHHYVCSPVCSPSRAGLLTGRYPQRSGVTGVLRDQHDSGGMSLAEETVADTLAAGGYQTALIGKWHLGMGPEYWPRRRGFHHYHGFLNGVIDYHTHLSRGGGGTGTRTTYRNETPVEEKGYYPELLHREAVRFIEQDARPPFFLYFSHPLPHSPLQAPDRYIAPYRHLPEDRAVYAGMVSCLDDGIGQMLAALDRRGYARDTLVVFFSDNGWVKLPRQAAHGAGSNGPLRGGKYELTEGGIRAPAIARWPGRIPAGSVRTGAAINLDWLPTFREAAGIRAAPRRALDGTSLLGMLTRGARLPDRTLYWSFEDKQVGTPPSLAARRGPWKYLDVGGQRSLFHLGSDEGERVDRSGEAAGRLGELRRAAEGWRAGL